MVTVLFLIQAAVQPVRQLLSSVPEWLWLVVAIAAVGWASAIAYALFGLQRMKRACLAQVTALAKIGTLTDDVRLNGQTLAAVDRWREAVRKLPAVDQPLGEDIERQLVTVRDDERQTRYRLLDGDGPIWTVDALGQRFLNLALTDAVPGLLTAFGLVGTFAAIAYGLGGLSEQENGVIAGVGGLLGGLGGKFVTSIAALALAFLFQLFDVGILKPGLNKWHTALTDAVAKTFPRQTAAQQVADLLESGRRQEKALSNISSDVVSAFGSLFSSTLLPDLSRSLATSMHGEIGPVMREVAAGIRALDEGIKRLEAGKQESLGGELRTLIDHMQRSITEALAGMGAEFRTSLSGSAGREFDHATGALRDSAEVLRHMNASFESMQGTLQRVLDEAESRATRTFEEGEGRTKALNDLVERLVGQLNESATTSAGEVQRLLVEAVSSMSVKLSTATEAVEARLRDATAQSTRASEDTIAKATQAAGRTTADTQRLLETLGQRSADFVTAADQLKELRQGVERVLAETGSRVRELTDVAAVFRSVATEASTMTRSLKESQDQHRRAAEAAAGMVARIGEVASTQVQAADRAKVAFEAADRIMDDLDTQLDRTLQVIVSRMQDYNAQVEKNFEKILGSVNQKMPELFTRLEGALQQLGQTVEELTDVVGSTKTQPGRGSA
jgi:ABC-type transporter Mla subunit MlaD